GYTLPAHAESRALPHVLIEIRQDLIHEAAGAESWATLLHDCLVPILHGLGRHPGRRSGTSRPAPSASRRNTTASIARRATSRASRPGICSPNAATGWRASLPNS